MVYKENKVDGLKTRFQPNEEMIEALLFYNAFCTLGMVFSIIARYQTHVKWLQSRNLALPFDTLTSIGTFWSCFSEVCFVLISPLPYLDRITFNDMVEDYKAVIQFNINDILLCISFYRIIFFARFVLVISKFTNPRAQRICQMNGCEARLIFAIRSVMREYPYQVIAVCLFSSILCLAY